MFKHQRNAMAAIISVGLLVACITPGGPQDSRIPTPSLWSRLTGGAKNSPLNGPLAQSQDAEVEQQWWKHFEDPTLDGLIAEALANNKTLQIAKSRVEEARADRIVARAALLPEVDGKISESRGNGGFTTNNEVLKLKESDLEATWELDVFGRNQARMRQAAAILQSAEASQQAVRVELLAEVARNYFDLCNDRRQIALTRENLETQKKTLDLTKAQLKGALVSGFDVARAGAQVSTTEALIPALQAQEDATLDRLDVLLGTPPGMHAVPEGAWFKPLDAQVLVAAPAVVLAARPDVRVAERNFMASIEAKSAARAQLFPDISLAAFYGAQSSKLFMPLGSQSMSSNPWSIGFTVMQPILNFGRIRAQIDAASAQQQQAFLNYQQAVLEALENMENAISSYLHESTRNLSLAEAVEQNRKAAELARQQYTDGDTSLLDVLTTERDRLNAEASEAASDAALRKDLVNIYTAAGGGWKD